MIENRILTQILNQSGIGYWDWNLKENTTLISDNLLSIFGYTEGELFPIGYNITYLNKIILHEDLNHYQTLLDLLINDNNTSKIDTELRYYHKNGTVIWLQSTAQVIERDENNKAIRIVGSHKNITTLKNQNELLQKEYNVLKLILDDLPQSVYWRDKDYKYLGCNKSFAISLRQKDSTHVINKTNYDFDHLSPEDIEMYHKEDNEVLSNSKARLHFIGQIDNHEGKKIWVDSSKVPLKDNHGKPYAVLGIFSDITEHENIKAELIRTNKLYNTLSLINGLLHKIDSKEDLYTNVCRIVTEVGGFQLAWIGEIEENEIKAKAYAGSPVDYLKSIHITTVEGAYGFGPTTKSILQGNKYICNDFFADINAHPWREAAIKSGIKASANFPIKVKDKTIGSLTVYANAVNYFQTKEILLLEEVAMLITFGLEELHRESYKKIAERKIKQLADIIEYSSTFVAISTPDGKDVYKNNAFKKALAIEGLDVTQFHFNDFHTPKAKEIVASVINLVMENGIATFENELISKKGHVIPVLQTIMLHKNDNNEPEFLSTTAIDISDLKKKEEELKKIATDLRSLSNHLITVREEERKIIAKEIHDELGQNLAILKMDAAWISSHLDGDKQKMQEKIQQFNEITDETVKTSRRLYNSLYPQMIDDIGLVGAIKWHANKYYDNNEVKINFNTTLDEIKLPPGNNHVSLVLFRIYQECFTNIMRHANAKRIEISIHINQGFIKLKIQDNGKGFIVNEVDTLIHHGLIGMRERVNALDGTMNIHSELGQGTITSVSIPLV